MAVEQRLQTNIIKYLKSKGCYVLNTTPGGGIPSGCPDVIALADGGGWIAIEVKASTPYRKDGHAKKGAFRPLQQETVAKLNEMYFARIAWPENWGDIRKELDSML